VAPPDSPFTANGTLLTARIRAAPIGTKRTTLIALCATRIRAVLRHATVAARSVFHALIVFHALALHARAALHPLGECDVGTDCQGCYGHSRK
jgi:hypothetical protein